VLTPLVSRPLSRLSRRWVNDATSIFALHRFTSTDLGITGHAPDRLRANLAYLRREGFALRSLEEFVRGTAAGSTHSRPSAVFTVDDGYSDFLNVALPIFAEFDCPVTVFVSTGVIDGEHWYWWDKLEYIFSNSPVAQQALTSLGWRPEQAMGTQPELVRRSRHLVDALVTVPEEVRGRVLEDLRMSMEVDVPVSPPPSFAPMTWTDIERCDATGIATFGPHTISHPALPTTSDAQATREIIGSWERIQERVPSAVPVFCYPFGAYSEREVGILSSSDMLGAVTVEPTYAQRSSSLAGGSRARSFSIPRFGYPDETIEFSQVVSGFEGLKAALRRRFSGRSVGGESSSASAG